MSAVVVVGGKDSTGFLDPAGKYKLVSRGAGAAVEAVIYQGDGIKADRARTAVITMSSNVDKVQTEVLGSPVNIDVPMFCACFGSFTARVPFYMINYRLKSDIKGDGNVLLAPPASADAIVLLDLNKDATPWYIMVNYFLAADEQVSLETRHLSKNPQGAKGAKDQICVFEARGPGKLLVSGHGSISRYELLPGEERTIGDVCHVLAWTSPTTYEYTGEAKPITFKGPGSVCVQTTTARELANSLMPYIPVQAAPM